jgi:hypothetical protein
MQGQGTLRGKGLVSDPSHERDARALLGDLLVLIAQREEIREMLGDLSSENSDRLLSDLVDELQGALQKRQEEKREPESDESITQNEIQPPGLEPDVSETLEPIAAGPEETAILGPEEPAQVPVAEPLQENEVPLTKRHQSRIPFELNEQDYLYLHGVTTVPLEEKPAPKPFMLEEKGIENSEFAFVLDRGGLRFFLSRLTGQTLNVSKSGMLLFNKQESIRMRGLHETIVNELRGHGVVLPFEFGTVALGLEDLFGMVDAQLEDLRDAVDELMATTWWNLSAFMLDAKLAQVLRAEAPSGRRERERTRQSYASVPPPTGRLDIKTLERILGKQKKIAESIHAELSQVAERSEVETMVGLGSGTTDDWKPILKASYEVRPAHVQQLNRVITDIQYRHFLFELMLSLTGDRESYSFQGS